MLAGLYSVAALAVIGTEGAYPAEFPKVTITGDCKGQSYCTTDSVTSLNELATKCINSDQLDCTITVDGVISLTSENPVEGVLPEFCATDALTLILRNSWFTGLQLKKDIVFENVAVGDSCGVTGWKLGVLEEFDDQSGCKHQDNYAYTDLTTDQAKLSGTTLTISYEIADKLTASQVIQVYPVGTGGDNQCTFTQPVGIKASLPVSFSANLDLPSSASPVLVMTSAFAALFAISVAM